MQIAVPREEFATSSTGGTDESWPWKTLLTFPDRTIDLDPATTSEIDKKTQPGAAVPHKHSQLTTISSPSMHVWHRRPRRCSFLRSRGRLRSMFFYLNVLLPQQNKYFAPVRHMR